MSTIYECNDCGGRIKRDRESRAHARWDSEADPPSAFMTLTSENEGVVKGLYVGWPVKGIGDLARPYQNLDYCLCMECFWKQAEAKVSECRKAATA